ncbi:serine/threonine-protein phosphatase [Ornithinibacillus sp. BX22]|uniref:Serine/threonine-protein phosphatase n=2 Tax=Ornithinibacillus TaxID=484508 RepID=A0A923RIQ6_9BACI|nr:MULTISPECIES: protein phosphatase 2C domain-containing protein [Ornithinibacillus]MBC5637341.1 serine/threonine-protein phosphatase [Ornithinibacillus hominis]MBS3680352.1 serine/threonine-protein phosphatase [Ornithinibacillus massiliensis]
MRLNWKTGIATHQGTKKKKNEDSYLIRFQTDSKENELGIFVVADGMGGYQVGDTASRLAIETIEQWWDRRIDKILKRKNVVTQITKELTKLFNQINRVIIETSKNSGKKMGTTVTFLALYKGQYGIVHIGDSRVYQLKETIGGLDYHLKQVPHGNLHEQTEVLEAEPEFIQITEDHSWVEKQVLVGKLTEEEARNHPKRNVLLQCLGIEEDINPYTKIGNYNSSDLFLLCSDGFYSLYSNKEIKDMLLNLEKEYSNYQSVCEYLINFSNFSNAHDNITLILTKHLYYEQENRNNNSSWFSFMKHLNRE